MKRLLNMQGLGVDAIGKSSGLALLWVIQTFVDLVSFSNNQCHIDAQILLRDEGSHWNFKDFYGASKEQIKCLRLEFDQLCSAEEIKWKQRGRQHGLQKRIEILLYAKASQQWLKPFLNSIISPSQSAFIHGSLITDNVLVAFEVNHFLKGERGSKSGHVVIKLDRSKVYDIE
ncbi:hypothetical protein Sango_1014500 [Sesamum angolense]|uniref:Uncharacterized protein n=1 Tax=Sesamum angolense TaxID=2727404 RepID=A0AAE2BYR7_9LAMI|nr:hypothetical protein Sango_1014500 [Sesamum angolense]